MPAQVLGIRSLDDSFSSQFRPYDGKTRKFHRPKKQKGAIERSIESSLVQWTFHPPPQRAIKIILDDDVDEVDEADEVQRMTVQNQSPIPVGQQYYRNSRYGSSGRKRQLKLPTVALAEPGRQSDPFKVFPIAYQDCVPEACEFC